MPPNLPRSLQSARSTPNPNPNATRSFVVTSCSFRYFPGFDGISTAQDKTAGASDARFGADGAAPNGDVFAAMAGHGTYSDVYVPASEHGR